MDKNVVCDLNCVILTTYVISYSYDLYRISENAIHGEESCNKMHL